MAGLADIFGGGGMFGGSGALYGDMLSPEQKQALAFRGLMAAAGALGQAAMPSRMPVPLGAALGQAAGAMASGQDEGAMNALRAALVGLQGKELQSKQTIRDALMKDLMGGTAVPGAAAVPAPGGGSSGISPAALTGPLTQPAKVLAEPLAVPPAGLSAGGAIPSQTSAALPAWINDPDTGGLRNIPGLDQTAQQRAMAQFKQALLAQNAGGAAPAADTVVGQTSPADAAALAGSLSQSLMGGGPPVRLAQNGPMPVPAAPPAFGNLAPGGAADPLQAQLQSYARRNAMADLAGFGNPYNSMIGVLQGSPQYRGAIEAATRGAGLPFVQPEAFAKEQGTRSAGIPYDVLLKNLQADLDRRNAFAQQGAQLGPDGVIAPVPGFSETIAGTKGAAAAAEEKAKAEQDIVTVPVPAPNGMLYNVKMTRAEAARRAAGAQQAPLADPAAPSAPAPIVPPQQGSVLPGGAVFGEPAGMGTIPPGQQMLVTPGGVKYENVPGGPQAEAKGEKEKGQAQSINVVTQDIDRALGMSGALTTGPIGTVLQGVPGTPAHNLQQILIGLKANTGFAELNKMRAQSPSGGALGPVSDNENKLLQSTLGSLEQSQSKDQFEFNLRRLHNIYLDVVNGSPAQLDAAVKGGKLSTAQRDAVLAIPRYELPATPAQPGGPAAAKAPANAAGVRSEAADAIAKGAPRDAVIKRLQSMGIDPSGL